jgi:tetratricopeptide (TPR) repeat protein
MLGKSHPNVATWYNDLAVLLQHLGKYAEAEPLYRRGIEIDEKVLGKDHRTVATFYNNFALLLHDQGKYAEAEPLYRRAFEAFRAPKNLRGQEQLRYSAATERAKFRKFWVVAADGTKVLH